VVRRGASAIALGALLLIPVSVLGQQPDEHAPSEAAESRTTDIAKFLAGAGLKFVIHESGHLAFDEIFDAHPHLQAVHFGPFPFFAITPLRPLSSRQLFTVASAGFWAEDLSAELLLPRHADLRHEHAPFAKGMLAFDVLTETGYALVAFAEAGPIQRDTHGMAVGLGTSERVIGAIVLTPAVLEAYRYFRPESRWARWAMWMTEAGSALLVIKPARK
jgi:hypothetical protein